MNALVTDVRYRMSAALIRELADMGVTVYTCETEGNTAIGSSSKYVKKHFTLPREGYREALTVLLEKIGNYEDEKPVLLPAGASTLSLIASDTETFASYARICVSDISVLDHLNDKAALAETARRTGVPVPEEYFGGRVYPCVVKPLCGEKLGLHAEARYRIARNEAEADSAIAHFTELSGEKPICQEYLPGEGAGCSVAARDGEVFAYICHKRIREYPVSGGPSSCCITVEDRELTEYTKKLVKAVNFSGIGMFEYKKNARGEWRLLECNPRIWGSFPLVRVSGSSLAKCWYALAAGMEIPEQHLEIGRKMIFFPSDVMAGISYAGTGRAGKLAEQIRDLLNPAVRDGVFEFRDPGPAFRYYRSVLKGRG